MSKKPSNPRQLLYYPFETLTQHFDADNLQQLAARAGVTPRSVHRWKKAGKIPEPSGDRIAINMGSHPANIWPAEYRRFAAGEQ